MLLCLAYPQLSKSDEMLIHDFRRKHDQKYVDVVDPHWTMIFPGSSQGISQNDLQNHIHKISQNNNPIEFTTRYALVHNDAESDDYYIFLVPDEGFSEISLLHDQLYSDFMQPKLRLDIPYIPHIGIATSKDPNHLHKLATQWNQARHEIKGTINQLTLCTYNGTKVENLKHFPLTQH